MAATLVQRDERNGFMALVLTADTPRLDRREADIKNKMIAQQLKNLEGLLSTKVTSDTGSNLEAYAKETMDPSLSWKDIEWLRSITNLTSFDQGAIKAVEVGVAGIIVSNHGARQLDYTPATISALEEVVHAVKQRDPILMDGGVRRGTDVFKALALGAQAVLDNKSNIEKLISAATIQLLLLLEHNTIVRAALAYIDVCNMLLQIGRPVIHGLAAKGEYGVRRVIEMLRMSLT
ncbi:peroxisomal (S)-2-hydroxy-acid oxidase GLO4 [Citrus sinensis]|uniref:Peroxisomal (S)-2-hydroxy-acid oxidase GLO4 n=2 Tax=Citrus sinensis TaxID=2711 RepID=A0ACB8J7Q3_CITSI|nr:peroxisomal (S)-2-hydroxy-acid oxidase GLO4 [Citrus sinensis]